MKSWQIMLTQLLIGTGYEGIAYFLWSAPPDALLSSRKAGWIDLRENHLEDPWPSLLRLPNLSCILLSGNHVSIVPSSVTGLKRLQCLRMDRNDLRVLPAELGTLKLIELRIAFNFLTEFPVARFPMLSTIDLRNNLLHPSFSVEIEEDRWAVKKMLDRMERSDPLVLVQVA